MVAASQEARHFAAKQASQVSKSLALSNSKQKSKPKSNSREDLDDDDDDELTWLPTWPIALNQQLLDQSRKAKVESPFSFSRDEDERDKSMMIMLNGRTRC